MAIALLATTISLWFIQTDLSEKNAISLLKLNMADVDAFAGEAEQFDDITMLCLTWHGPRNEEVSL